MFVIAFVLLLVLKGRDYYLAPAYPMLFAAGAVMCEHWRPLAQRATWAALGVGGALAIPPVNSFLWNSVSSKLYDFREEIGWPELVDTVAGIRNSLPDAEPAETGILGEAGAIDLYGPGLGLPKAISGVNSYWLRGYGDPPRGL
jgi:hypothetical protein